MFTSEPAKMSTAWEAKKGSLKRFWMTKCCFLPYQML